MKKRSSKKIGDEIGKLTDLLWYTRCYCDMEVRVAAGLEDAPPDDIMYKAHKSARRIEKEHAGELGPYSDFEWGMINGKLSALRWVMGDEWDFLDT